MSMTDFLNELMQDSHLQEAFMRRPRQVMAARLLSPAEQEAILSCNRDRMAEHVGDWIKHHPIGATMLWGAPGHPRIVAASPNHAQRGKADPVRTIVVGRLEGGGDKRLADSAMKGDVRCNLVRGDHVINGQVTGYDVVYPDWQLYVAFTIPAAAEPGSYDLVMSYDNMTDTLQNGFRVDK
jgi:hypothetical protein